VSRIHVRKFSSASVLPVHLYILLGICVYNGANLDELVRKRETEREKEKRNGAGDNNHNNLVKRYKDISR